MEDIKTNLRKAREQVGVFDIKAEHVGAAVSIDGRHVGRTPLDKVFVEPGAHRIEVSLDGYRRHEVEATAEKGEERAIHIKLAKVEPSVKMAPTIPNPEPMPAPGSDSISFPVAITGGALATISTAIGIGFTAASNNASAERHSHRAETKWKFETDCNAGATQPPCSEYANAEQARRDYARVAATAFIGAGILTAATVAYIAFPRTFAKPTSRMSGAALVVYQWH